MRTVTATAVVSPMEFPAGTEPGVYAFKFYRDGGETPEASVDTMVPNCSVTLAAGNWICTAQRYSDAGVALGSMAQTAFVIPAEALVTIGVVGDVSVSVGESIKTVDSVTVT